MFTRDTARMFTRYKAWANELVFSAVRSAPAEEITKPRKTTFRNMVYTLNHVYVIDRIFQAHLESRPHGYTARNTPEEPTFEALWAGVQTLDRWYIDLAERLTDAELAEVIKFEFVGGGDGAMTRGEILLHLVNHGTYHRGFVADMLNQAGVRPKASDLTVYLRDVART
jgi:uncharacterized damage-inducible protein DinB